MNLKNYTSTVDADKSIMRIERLLVSVGAHGISKQYQDGQLIAMSFLINVSQNTLAFKLPAKVKAVEKVLWRDVKRPKPDGSTKKRVQEQAERTAWKIISDWVEVQISMIQLEQAEIAEVFLPYAYNPELDSTLYQRLKENNFKQLN